MGRKEKERAAKRAAREEKRAKMAEASEAHDAADDQELTMEDVLALGGNKEDFELLRDLQEPAAEAAGPAPASTSGRKRKAGGALKPSELAAFVGGLGLDKVAPASSAAASASGPADAVRGQSDAKLTKKEKARLRKERRALERDAAAAALATTAGSRRDDSSPAGEDAVIEEASEDEMEGGETTGDEPASASALFATDAPDAPAVVLAGQKDRSRTLVALDGNWHESQSALMQKLPRVSGAAGGPDSLAHGESLASFTEYARLLLEREVETFTERQKKGRDADERWLSSVLSSGTIADKLSAMVIQVQASPVHRLHLLDSLMNLATKKGKRQALLAIDTLQELWTTSLLPARKLVPLGRRPLLLLGEDLHGKRTLGREEDALLLMWYFEDQLKRRYFSFAHTLNKHANDALATIRTKVVGTAFDLLASYPEQEQFLLTLLANKLGDPERTLAAKASHLLTRLTQQHPNMKTVVVKEVQRLLYRPNINQRAQYYAICFLNQVELCRADTDLANQLVAFYFRFFKEFVGRGKELLESRLLSALLSGVHRAYPFAKLESVAVDEHMDMLFKVIHVGAFGCAVQALMLVSQVMDDRNTPSDRLYRALYHKLLDPQLPHSSKQGMFLNVLFRSMKHDSDDQRTMAMAKRLLQVCDGHSATFLCGALYLVSRIVKLKPAVGDLITKQGSAVAETGPDGEKGPEVGYDPTKRDPQHARAGATALWELSVACKHFHPSVLSFAGTVADGDTIKYKGDPLADFTLMKFLDRFVFKNPKAKVSDHGGSVMQPKGKAPSGSAPAVNSPAYLKLSKDAVPLGEAFFHKYFHEKQRQDAKQNKRPRKADALPEEEDVGESLMAELGDASPDQDAAAGQYLDEEFESMDEALEEDGSLALAGPGADSGSEEYDYDNMPSFENDEGEFDLEAIARAPSDSEDERTEEAPSVFASAEEFSHLLEEPEGKGAQKASRWEFGESGGRRGKGSGKSGGKKRGGGKRKR